MKKTSFISSMALMALVSSLTPLSCSEPAIQCVAGHGPFIAKYTLREGSGVCAELKGEEIGLSTFLRPNADRTGADYDSRLLAIQSTTLGSLMQERQGLGADEADIAFSVGDYTSIPDSSNLCFAGGAGGTPTLSTADVDVPEAMTEDESGNPITLPAAHLRQQWQDVNVYVTAAVPGTRMTATMVFEDVLAGCSATYDVVGLFPAVPCAKTDENGAPTSEPDDAKCDAKADPASGRNFGSGINPDFKVKCDPELLYCVLDEPALPTP